MLNLIQSKFKAPYPNLHVKKLLISEQLSGPSSVFFTKAFLFSKAFSKNATGKTQPKMLKSVFVL